MNTFQYELSFKSLQGEIKYVKGEMQAIDASEVILRLVDQYPKSIGKVKRVSEYTIHV